MKIPSRAWGFVRVGLNGSFGVTVPNFGTGGTDGNPLDNDVDAGDEAAGVEFCPVFASQPSSGTLTVWTDGSLSLVGAADGTYVLPYSLYTFTPGDSASVDEGATTYTVTVGAASIAGVLSATLGAAALSSSATLALSGVLSSTLADANLSAAGESSAPGTGSLSVTLSDAGLAASGVLYLSGDVAATLEGAALLAVGVEPGAFVMPDAERLVREPAERRLVIEPAETRFILR